MARRTPTKRKTSNAAERAQVVAIIKGGESVPSVAKRLGYSESNVYRWVTESKGAALKTKSKKTSKAKAKRKPTKNLITSPTVAELSVEGRLAALRTAVKESEARCGFLERYNAFLLNEIG